MEQHPFDAARMFLVGTIVWAVAFVALLPFAGRLSDAGRAWWIWACLAGVGVGLLGWEAARWVRDRSIRE
ncbi:DUF2530 domain-containing protein [Nocardioides sp. Kera G14]|uniref:DUF2530 domain-containing protein n=1 Tax=Nocardioides sp. Kera G14 TaxID=2884264 RepID=UPI001D12F6B0|nr:DUF2530 domain-containing protein [Nocardioides sp. Kera G14]UDY24228.1 DUF2530 domain-containing protein [Nocardioides sp. Kera G14]